MDDRSPAEERLIETVQMYIPHYRPGWSASLATERRGAYWAKAILFPLSLVSLVFVLTQSGLTPYRDAHSAPHHGSFSLLFIAVAFSRRIGGEVGALTAAALSVLGLIVFSDALEAGPIGVGWLFTMGLAFVSVAFSSRAPSSGSGPPKALQHPLDQCNRVPVVDHRPPRSFAFH